MEIGVGNYHRTVNPLLQTKRGKVQQRRGALNEQISKQIRIRNGAENLLRVTSDRKIREQITLELSFLDSNLQLLKEELSEMNADVQIYQNDKCSTSLLPHLALGLKETKDVEFLVPFQDVVVEHYLENPCKFETQIRKFSDLRRIIRAPPRNEDGLKLLFQYYNHLCFVEKRFYSNHRTLSTYFEWYDAITGIPAIQKSIAFEKGSIIFNIAALYTQLGANEDRNTQIGLQKCLEYYGRAVGCFSYLKENFAHAPSNDMKNETLTVLILLFLAQIQECVWQICFDELEKVCGFHESFVLAQESSQVSKMYNDTNVALVSMPWKPYLPHAWTFFTVVKRDLFKAMAHHFTAVGILAIADITEDVQRRFKTHFDNANDGSSLNYGDRLKLAGRPWNPTDTTKLPPTSEQRKALAHIHSLEATRLIEECTSIIRLNKNLRKLGMLTESVKKYASIICRGQKIDEDLDAMAELYDPAPVCAKTTYAAAMLNPDFARFAVDDLFHELGPLSVFNAKTELSPINSVRLVRSQMCPGYGFSVKGDCPVAISSVDAGGLASICGLAVGDYIVAVRDQDCRWSSHDAVVNLIRQCGDQLTLQVVSVKGRPEETLPIVNGSCSASTRSFSSSTLSSTSSSTHTTRRSEKTKASSINVDVPKTKSSGWLSSTLPSSFKSPAKENKENCIDKPDVLLTSDSAKLPKSGKTSHSSSSSWRVRPFLSLKKNKSESKLTTLNACT